MKKTGSFLFVGLALMFFIGMTSCRKEKTTQDKITDTWTFDKVTFKVMEGEEVVDEGTFAGAPGEYITFRKDGTYTAGDEDNTEDGVYQLIGDDQIKFGNQILDIQALTDKSLVLYSKEIAGSLVTETWLHLVR